VHHPPVLSSVPVFFCDDMVVAEANSYSPSAGKPALVVRDWLDHQLPIEVKAVTPVSREQLSLAHDRAFVDGVLDGRRRNGFGNTLESVAHSLPFTTGSMLDAAREAVRNGGVACAPVSGFHHAGQGHAGGFCTFNGLMVTSMVLHAEGLVRRVAILDLDQHWGDGTQDIIDHLGVDWIDHHSSGKHSPGPSHAERYLHELPALVSRFAGCDLLLYQAGADAHINDPLGGWMTTEQLERRDRIVFTEATRIGLPVAWNLAGGYQKDANGAIPAVLEIHRNTMRACVSQHWRA
jgi:acetoin utilization deacetylase AcuC-like enzyme